MVRLGRIAGLLDALLDFPRAIVADLRVAPLEVAAVAVVVAVELVVVRVRGVVGEVLREGGGEEPLVLEAGVAEYGVGGRGRSGLWSGELRWCRFSLGRDGGVCDFAILRGGELASVVLRLGSRGGIVTYLV